MIFPLFKLPLLALIVVIQRMDLLELLSISLTSARVRNVTKRHTKSQKVTMKVTHRANMESVTFTNVKDMKMFMWPRSWNAPGATIEERLMNKITWLVDIFNVGLASCNFIDSQVESSCQILEHVKGHGLGFGRIYFTGHIGTVELGRMFLTACGGAEKLEMRIEPRRDFNSCLLNGIDNGERWTDSLSALMDCSNASILCPRLHKQVLNDFIESWMQGTGRIQKLGISCLTDVDEGIMDGIDGEEILADTEWRIQREDMTRARVYACVSRFEFNVLTD